MAGGSGRRMGGALPKQFVIVDGMPIVARTINTFAEALPGGDIVVVLPEEHIPMWQNLASRFDVAKHRCVAGGKERFHSVKAGVEALGDEVEYIAVHDGVRALVTKRLIIGAMLAAEEHKAVIPVMGVVDSYRQVEGSESRIIDRTTLRTVQTPQVFEAALLRKAYEQEYDAKFTDDASVVEAMGVNIALIEGERGNIKITTPDDLEYAEWLLHRER